MLLRPTERRFLPHTVTFFNVLTHEKDMLLAVTARHVLFQDSNAFTFRQTGAETKNAFRLEIDYVSSDLAGRQYAPLAQWKLAESREQEEALYTLYPDLWLFLGEHADFPPGGKVPASAMTAGGFSKRGLRLLKAGGFDVAGYDPPHHFLLSGAA